MTPFRSHSQVVIVGGGIIGCFKPNANWFDPPGVKPDYEHSYGRQNRFEPVRQECDAVRNDAAIHKKQGD